MENPGTSADKTALATRHTSAALKTILREVLSVTHTTDRLPSTENFSAAAARTCPLQNEWLWSWRGEASVPYSLRPHGIAQDSDAFDTRLEHFAVLQPPRIFLSHDDALGSTGGNHVARLERKQA